jgi:hypothetical protein
MSPTDSSYFFSIRMQCHQEGGDEHLVGRPRINAAITRTTGNIGFDCGQTAKAVPLLQRSAKN